MKWVTRERPKIDRIAGPHAAVRGPLCGRSACLATADELIAKQGSMDAANVC